MWPRLETCESAISIPSRSKLVIQPVSTEKRQLECSLSSEPPFEIVEGDAARVLAVEV